MPRGPKLTTQGFIDRSKDIHKNIYDYSKAQYTERYEKVEIICKIHGSFFQNPTNHLQGIGCQKCGIDKIRYKKDDFIKKATEMHGDRYDYSKLIYTGSKNKVEIICKKHGSFYPMPSAHLRGSGCSKCVGNIFCFEDFIEKAKLVYNDKYKYVDFYKRKRAIYINIICPIHSNFSQSVFQHLSGFGCRKCRPTRNSTTEKYISLVKSKYGGNYDYSETNYISSRSKIKIICPEHGPFMQQANSHAQGQGCPKCKESKGEKSIRQYLLSNGIKFESQKAFSDCIYKYVLRFDFCVYLKNKYFLIEYNGRQHYEIGNFSKNKEQNRDNYDRQLVKDQIKLKYCAEKNIPLLIITYKEFKKIPSVIQNFISNL